MRRVNSGWIRRGLVALATVILAAVTTISVPAPASADPFGGWCFRWNGQVICVPVSINWDWQLECPQCGLAVDWLPDPQQVVGRQVAIGLGDLSNARLTADPVQRAQLRARAFDAFTQAAVYAGVRPFVGQVGFMDEGGVINAGPQPVPWLQASAQDIAAGIGFIQLALNDWTGGGAAYRQLAVAKLDEAYLELANAQVIGN
jgi:hypothetical protein